MLAIVTVGTIYKMVQSLLIKIKPSDPGRSLTREEAPGLWLLTEEVARDIGTRPVEDRLPKQKGPGKNPRPFVLASYG